MCKCTMFEINFGEGTGVLELFFKSYSQMKSTERMNGISLNFQKKKKKKGKKYDEL